MLPLCTPICQLVSLRTVMNKWGTVRAHCNSGLPTRSSGWALTRGGARVYAAFAAFGHPALASAPAFAVMQDIVTGFIYISLQLYADYLLAFM